MPLVARQAVQFHDLRLSGRDFVVGDLHGCLPAFWALLRHVHFDLTRDRVFSVGDLVDRGPESWGCLRLLRMPWFHACLGNHEARLISHLRDPVQRKAYDPSWLFAPGGDRLGLGQFAEAWLPVLEALPAVMVVGPHSPDRFNVVHGELLNQGSPVTDAMIDEWTFADPAKALERATYGRSLKQSWENRRPTRRAHDPLRMSPTYCGHSILPQPSWLNRQAYIDGGAFLGLRSEQLDQEMEMEPAETSSDMGPVTPGLVLAEPRKNQFWLAPTGSREIRVRPLTMATLELR